MEMQVEMDFGSERANEVVQQSGWTASRRIDTTDYERFFEAENLPALPAALEALSEFGGLRLQGLSPYTSRLYVWVDFDPVDACDIQPSEFLRECSFVAKRDLTPIAKARNELWVLLVDEEGQVYALDDLTVFYLGDNIYEAIKEIFIPGLREQKVLGSLY